MEQPSRPDDAAQDPGSDAVSAAGPRRHLRPPISLVIFTGAYLLAAVVAAFATGNREFVFYIIVMIVLIGVIALVHRRIVLTRALMWAFSIWGLLHMAGGLVPVPAGWPYNPPIAVFYSLWLIPEWLKYDHVVHAYGFGVTTWLCWHALASGFSSADATPVRPTAGALTLCAAAGLGFGAFNEVVEFIATLTIPNTNVGGYANTGWDLVSNLIGAILAAVLIRCRAGLRAARAS